MHNQLQPVSSHKPANQSPKKLQTHSRKKATQLSEFVANRRLSYKRGVKNGGSNQHYWQLISACAGSTKPL
jgi:hypothetical protein